MALTCFRCIQYSTAVMFVLSFGLTITAGIIKFWWVKGYPGIAQSQEGLWRSCQIYPRNSIICANRKDVFEFDKNHGLNKDIILVSLVVAALSSLFGFVFGLIAACQRIPKKCNVWFEVIFSFLGSVGTLFAIVWALVKIGNAHTSWAFYCVYGAAGLLFFSFMASVLMLTMNIGRSYHDRSDEETVMLQRKT